jgi:purine-binding chemotaxis protein CheW
VAPSYKGAVAGEKTTQLVFLCRDLAWAVSSTAALELISLPPMTRVPGAPPHVLGVFVYRGQLLPLIDLPALLCPGGTPLAVNRAVVLQSRLGPFGVPVTRVLGPMTPSPTRPPRAEHPPFVVGLIDDPARDTLALDPDRLVRFLSE